MAADIPVYRSSDKLGRFGPDRLRYDASSAGDHSGSILSGHRSHWPDLRLGLNRFQRDYGRAGLSSGWILSGNVVLVSVARRLDQDHYRTSHHDCGHVRCRLFSLIQPLHPAVWPHRPHLLCWCSSHDCRG